MMNHITKVDHSLEFDTHSTSQEHAGKEAGSWREFLEHIEIDGQSLPADIKTPFEYYLLQGPGLFYRAFHASEPKMIAGIALSPLEDTKITKIDALYTLDESSLSASGLYRILSRKVLGTAPYTLPGQTGIEVSANLATKNEAVSTAFSDFIVKDGAHMYLPLPGIITRMVSIPTGDEEKLKQHMPPNFTGILRYCIDEEHESQETEEIYRNGVFATKKSITYSDEDSVEVVTNSAGNEIEAPLSDESEDLPYTPEETTHYVKFLAALAKRDTDIATLLLTR